MNYTEKTKPGMGDPYWYEWSVGEQQIINMLNGDNNIEFVELQANVGLGLDDVVVTYKDGSALCIQVKHTRAEDTLTFTDLIYSAKNTSKSLLAELADSWQEESSKYTKVIPQIFTNRRTGQVSSLTKGKDKFIRPALDFFWTKLNEKLKSVDRFEKITFEECPEAWNEWKTQLNGIQSDDDKLKFLRLLELETEQKDLQEIENEVVSHLATGFGISLEDADKLLGKLDHALRKWTTSVRNTSRIYVEDVYEALSIDNYISPYNHELIPAEPFFESRRDFVGKIETELLSGKEKVLFLSGIPGTGKTNIVSKLCNKRDSIIKIRYYAYEPIQPDKEYLPMDVSERVKKEHFWNEVFSQLKQCLKGSLHKYNVPLQNCFMSLEEMKTRFFEIASNYAKDTGCTFVVAIDGIDHAARAGIITDTFLATLPRPEYIPDNIKLLISGQPQESYPNYPLWLKRTDDNVKTLDVPGIEREDILSLVAQKISATRNSEYNAITDVIERYSEKNTLAAIFAVYEASQCADVIELARRLSDRNLSGNIEEYYSAIWDNAVGTLKQYDFLDYKLAGVFAFLNERVDGQMLAEIFPELAIPVGVWNNVLKILKPLIIEDTGKYHVLHNDVKVFLSNIVNIDDEHMQEIANSLTNYYLYKEDKNQAFYFDIIRLMSMAKREKEMVDVFTSKFVIEAYVNGVELSELTIISNNIMKGLFLDEVIDYSKLQRLSTAILTIDKLENTKYEIEDSEFRDVRLYVGVAPYECYVEPINQWDAHLISDVLSYARSLYYSGKTERAVNVFNRWFEGLSVLELWNILKGKGMLDTRNPNYIMISTEAKEIADDLGKLLCWSKQYNMLEKIAEWDDEITVFMRVLCESFWHESVLNYKDEELETALISIRHFAVRPETLIDILIKLIGDLNFSSINIIENVNRELFTKSKLGMVFDLFMRIVSGNIENYDKYKREDVYNQIKDIELPHGGIEHEIYYYSIYAVVVSYLLPAVDRTVVSQRVLEKYLVKHSHSEKSYYGLWFNSLCYLGYWLYAKHNEQSFAELSSEIERILSLLIIKDWFPKVLESQTRNIYSLILKAYIIMSSEENEEYKSAVLNVCEKIFANNPVHQVMDAGWYFYRENVDRLTEWYQDWLGENGKVWDNPIGDRNRIIKDILHLVDKYQLGSFIDTSVASEKAKWSVIGYASHKEYSLSDILDWYDNLIETGYEDTYKYTEQIKSLSAKMEELGDNRLDYQANCKLYGDLFGNGLDTIKKVFSIPVYMSELLKQPEYIIEGLIGYLKGASVSENDLLSIWAFGLGMLNWKNESNHSAIVALDKAIEICAERNNLLSLYEKIGEMGKAEISARVDPSRYIIPSRWCDKSEKEKSEEIPRNYIERYLQLGELEYHDRQKFFEECEAMRDEKEAYYSCLGKVLKKELVSERYGWRNRDILKYAINNLPNNIADEHIRSYFVSGLEGERESFCPGENLTYLCLWKVKQCGQEYCKQGLDNLLNTHSLWISSAERIGIQEGNTDEDVDTNLQRVYGLLDIESMDSFEDLFIRILIVFMLSDNCDTAENALRGIYQLLCVNPELVMKVENYWNEFHYRAKEWMLMIYELLSETGALDIAQLESLTTKHINDFDFNVAFYSRLLLQRLCGKNGFDLPKEKQEYFTDIPEYSTNKLLSIKNSEQHLTGTTYVMEALEHIEEEMWHDCSDIECKVAAYVNKIADTQRRLLNVGGTKQCCVALYDINVAFLRVLYKEWYKGRWAGEEIPLSRIILSASEPYILLQSPAIWPYQANKLLDIKIDEFEVQGEDSREEVLKNIFNMGISDKEIVLGGALSEYSYKKELSGFMTTYIDFPAMKKNFALYACERSVRLLIHRSDEFEEERHSNLLVHNTGVASFKGSNIMCMFSQRALNHFKWKIVFNNGLKIVNSNDETIGRFDYYYGLRTDMGNSIYMYQPVIQRWVVTKTAFDEIQSLFEVDLKQVADARVFEF